MEFKLPELPYAQDALAPHISAETVHYHYDKHHATYLKKLDAAIDDADRGKTLEEIIQQAHAAGSTGIFNNAAQVWNHNFYCNSLKPGAAESPSAELAQAIDSAFGSMDEFRKQFSAAAAGQFGSGWAWLVKDGDGSVKITTTANADLPLVHGQTALLTVDVWEHAYYIDYRNERPRYLDTVINELLNWEFASSNFAA
jgi:Fe-Mn family superoxide dismutase